MFKSVDLYIDLGTANILVYGRGRGFMLNEPCVLAVKQTASRRQQIFGLGKSAKAMLGTNPQNILVHKPLKEGVIADFENTARMLESFIHKVRESTYWFRPRIILSLPCRVANYESVLLKRIIRSMLGSL